MRTKKHLNINATIFYGFLFLASPSVLSVEKPREKIKINLIQQQTNNIDRQLFDNSCGIASLSYVLNKYYNKNTSEKNIFFFIGLKPEYSLGDLKKTSRKFGIQTVGLKLTVSDLKKINSPTILKTKTNGGHFIVYTGHKNGWFQIVDPAKGRMNYYESELEKIFIDEVNKYGSALVFFSKNKNNFIDYQLHKNTTNRLLLDK